MAGKRTGMEPMIVPLEIEAVEAAQSLRSEIIAVGRKLWERQYVDGNGGNISTRLGENYLLCTPTMMSKRDMEPGTFASPI